MMPVIAPGRGVKIKTSLRGRLTYAYFQDDEVDQILAYVDKRIEQYSGKKKLYMYRYRFLFEIMLSTGVRVGEAIHWYDNRLGLTYGIRPIDFALDEGKYGTLYVQSEKKRRVQPTRKIPIQSELKTALYEYMDRVRRYTGIPIDSSSRDYLFPMTYSAVKKFIEKIGEETGITGIEYVKSKEKKGQLHKIHPHMFRHTFGVRCAVGGIPITIAQRWLGHGDPFVTTIYQQVGDIDTSSFIDMVRPINESMRRQRGQDRD